ncbi:polysaccharide biosynthesis/export family protein [Flaviramulus aquimarinus]|uniref:Polysaccharide biosynthesis/export family protein n=1 Tax=Flaviramulus aquimarinus TaxID=1170456 RepID=A0ABP9ENZ6_9FLAO
MFKIKHIPYKQFLITLLVGSLLIGCKSSKKINYFQDEKGHEIEENITLFQPTIQFGDILTINVASTEPEAALPFNIYESQIGNLARPLPYIVNADGEINFPGLGKFKVAQLTIKQVTDELHKKLLPYLNNPIVNVRLNNFRVSVLGEVRNPGSYSVQSERINILEAIAQAGDLTIYGKRKTVTLIREQNGKRTSTTIDLTDKNLFSSPYYYLAQNDIIYVESNKTRVNASAVGPNTGIIVSTLSILISLAAILVD